MNIQITMYFYALDNTKAKRLWSIYHQLGKNDSKHLKRRSKQRFNHTNEISQKRKALQKIEGILVA